MPFVLPYRIHPQTGMWVFALKTPPPKSMARYSHGTSVDESGQWERIINYEEVSGAEVEVTYVINLGAKTAGRVGFMTDAEGNWFQSLPEVVPYDKVPLDVLRAAEGGVM